MPTSVLESHEASSTCARNGFRTSETLFCKQFSIAINTVSIMRLICSICVLNGFIFDVACCKSLSSQRLAAITTVETISVPGFVAEGDSTGNDDLLALGALGGILVLVTFDAYFR